MGCVAYFRPNFFRSPQLHLPAIFSVLDLQLVPWVRCFPSFKNQIKDLSISRPVGGAGGKKKVLQRKTAKCAELTLGFHYLGAILQFCSLYVSDGHKICLMWEESSRLPPGASLRPHPHGKGASDCIDTLIILMNTGTGHSIFSAPLFSKLHKNFNTCSLLCLPEASSADIRAAHLTQHLGPRPFRGRPREVPDSIKLLFPGD